MTLDLQLVGSTTQMAVISLVPGQTVFSEAGKFLFASDDVVMETKLSQPSGGGGPGGQGGSMAGLAGGLLRGALDAGKRMMAGESFAFTHFSTRGGSGLLGLAGVLPGEMRALELDGRTTWTAEKDAFVAAEAGVRFDVAFMGGRAGFAGGEGIVLERFSGTGTLLVAGAGDFIDINPADHGGRIRVDTGCVVAWDQHIRYDVQRVGGLNRQGVMNAMFGGEGLTLAVLEGDGRVILQSVTIEGLAAALRKNAGPGSSKGIGGLGGIFGGSAD